MRGRKRLALNRERKRERERDDTNISQFTFQIEKIVISYPILLIVIYNQSLKQPQFRWTKQSFFIEFIFLELFQSQTKCLATR